MTAPAQLELRRAEAPTWGPRLNADQSKLKKWTPRRSGALLGYADVHLPSGLVINGLRIMTGRNGLWVAMPAQKQLDRDGQPRLDGNGKPVYSQIVEFKDKATADRFAELVLGLIRRENPDALDGGQ